MPAMSDLVSPTRMHSGEALDWRRVMAFVFINSNLTLECSNDDRLADSQSLLLELQLKLQNQH